VPFAVALPFVDGAGLAFFLFFFSFLSSTSTSLLRERTKTHSGLAGVVGCAGAAVEGSAVVGAFVGLVDGRSVAGCVEVLMGCAGTGVGVDFVEDVLVEGVEGVVAANITDRGTLGCGGYMCCALGLGTNLWTVTTVLEAICWGVAKGGKGAEAL
jgi:hypothetical protein